MDFKVGNDGDTILMKNNFTRSQYWKINVISPVNITFKRGVMDTNGTIYKLTSMTNNCLTHVTYIGDIAFPQHKISEFNYSISGFPLNLSFVTFRNNDMLSILRQESGDFNLYIGRTVVIASVQDNYFGWHSYSFPNIQIHNDATNTTWYRRQFLIKDEGIIYAKQYNNSIVYCDDAENIILISKSSVDTSDLGQYWKLSGNFIYSQKYPTKCIMVEKIGNEIPLKLKPYKDNNLYKWNIVVV